MDIPEAEEELDPIQRLKKTNIGQLVNLYGNYYDKQVWDEVVRGVID